MSQIGIIAIGRNEGERLRQCLTSVVGRGWPVVYVDSASTDGSAALARAMGAEVVDLDMSIPFSAARARNEGISRLLAIAPEVQYVQMVDGDCEVVAGWIDRAKQELDANPQTAVVCGRRRERFPNASIYNRIADIEWNTPIGEAKSCGGDAMFRVSAFQEAGGYDNTVVAGEEPELCQRLREKGWKVFRIDAEMTIHDSAMLRFGQWWKRSVRSGYGAMDVATRFRRGKDGLFVKQVKSARMWVLTASLIAWLTFGVTSGVLIAWPLGMSMHQVSVSKFDGWLELIILIAAALPFIFLIATIAQVMRIAKRVHARVPSWYTSAAYGVLTMIGKWANYRGQRQYVRDRRAGKLTRMIDYKNAGVQAVGPMAAD